MKKLFIDLLSEEAMSELKKMESNNKIRITEEGNFFGTDEKRKQIWKELEDYTYENILKKIKEEVE